VIIKPGQLQFVVNARQAEYCRHQTQPAKRHGDSWI